MALLLLDGVVEVLSTTREAVSMTITLLDRKSVDVLPKVGERMGSMHLMPV
jgi:hypothetical protein